MLARNAAETVPQTTEGIDYIQEKLDRPSLPPHWTYLLHGTNLSKRKWEGIEEQLDQPIFTIGQKGLSVITKQERDEGQGDTTEGYSVGTGQIVELHIAFPMPYSRKSDSTEKFDALRQKYGDEKAQEIRALAELVYWQNLPHARHPVLPVGMELVKLQDFMDGEKRVVCYLPAALADFYQAELGAVSKLEETAVSIDSPQVVEDIEAEVARKKAVFEQLHASLSAPQFTDQDREVARFVLNYLGPTAVEIHESLIGTSFPIALPEVVQGLRHELRSGYDQTQAYIKAAQETGFGDAIVKSYEKKFVNDSITFIMKQYGSLREDHARELVQALVSVFSGRIKSSGAVELGMPEQPGPTIRPDSEERRGEER